MLSQYPDVDRGWAWVVLVCNSFGMFLMATTYLNVGVFYVALLDQYGEGKAKTTLVGALCTGLACCFSTYIQYSNYRMFHEL